MSEWKEENDRAFIEGVVKPLREPVRLDDGFDLRVMSAVHSAALAPHDDVPAKKGWNRRYTFSLTPIGAMAIAASFIGAVFIGSFLLPARIQVSPARSVASNAPRRVTEPAHFILVNGSAQQVWLVGDFNGWSRTQTPLVRAANGSAWTVSLALQPGRHEYAFIVVDSTGERWTADPLLPAREDEFGTESSIVQIGPTAMTGAVGS